MGDAGDHRRLDAPTGGLRPADRIDTPRHDGRTMDLHDDCDLNRDGWLAAEPDPITWGDRDAGCCLAALANSSHAAMMTYARPWGVGRLESTIDWTQGDQSAG